MITFKTKHHADIDMFDQVALNLIALMGHSKTVPGALSEEEIGPAIEKLTRAITKQNVQNEDSWDDNAVSLPHRAKPLLDLLETAKQHQEYVIWDKTLL